MPARSTPLRLTCVLTHPVQYFAPWFRHISAHAPDIDLTVLYITMPSDEQRGAGFGRAVDWGTPLLEGYRWRSVRGARPADSVASGSFWSLARAQVGPALAATMPDVVLVPGWHSAAYVRTLLTCRTHRIPVLYRGDTHLGTAPAGLRRLLWHAKNRAVLGLFDAYLAVGSRAQEFLSAHGVDDSRVFPSPHCVDNDFFAREAAAFLEPEPRSKARATFGLADDTFALLFVGKLEAGKRPLDLIRAAARLGRDFAILLVGSGALEDNCRREAEKTGVRLIRAGFLDQVALARAYAAADCLVVPSASETWGLVVNEALATGLPCVVSSGVGAGPDLIASNGAGRVYPVGDVEALSAAVSDVRAELKRSPASMRAACRSAVEAATFDRATDGLVGACTAVAKFGARSEDSSRLLVCGGGMVTLGGGERVLFEIARVARERGASVHILVNDWGASEIIRVAESIGATWSYTWVRAPLRRSRLTPLGILQYAWEFARTSATLALAAWRFRPTSVLLLDYTAALRNCFGLIALRAADVPITMKLANAPEPGMFYRRVWRWLVNPLVSTFVCNSLFTERELLACGISKRKVATIYNTLPTRPHSTVRPERVAGRVIYVGQIIPEKGLATLFDAVELLLARGTRISLDIVGAIDGWAPDEYVAWRAELRRRAESFPLRGRVRFLGWQENVAEFFAAASLHCCPSLPSIRESFGLVVLEAKAAQIPSVVFRSGALPELITHKRDGWICDYATRDALADGLEYFLSDPVRCSDAGRQAWQSLARFDRRRFADRWWAVVAAPRRLFRGQIALPEMP